MTAIKRTCARAGVVLFVAMTGTLAPTAAQTPAQPDTRPACVRAMVAMDETIDSSRSKSGDVFKFVLVEPATAPDGTAIPAGNLGYGVVANAAHAERGGRAGYLALETRFLLVGDGKDAKHVPAIIDRATDQKSTAVGATANAPGLLGLIPIVGYAVGGYDSLHHGKDATIQRGTRVGIFIGDDAALGTCRPLAAGESPPPAASPAPAAPAPAASPAPAGSPAPAASARP
ncbi:MAG: hypothetical protein JWM87_1466 [Candidatus Eremiobacteraeota bacterium]|nr:hypothetical protein [Candidatus Eremiobacteraeota bacterium]